MVAFGFFSQGGRVRARHTGSEGERLGELAIMKDMRWLARDDDQDLEDSTFLLEKMEEMGESFEQLQLGDGEEMGDMEALTTAGKATGGAHEKLLLKILA